MTAPSDTPSLVEGVDWRRLPLGPQEAFVLSRIDGRTPAAELSLATGLDEARIHEVIARLMELGAVRLGAPRRQAVVTPLHTPAPPGGRLTRPAIESAPESAAEAAALYDPAELDDDCDLDLARRRQVLDLFHRLDQLDHYELFGVSSDADKKDIKAAYYEAVKIYHPDRYFGRQLGGFKPRLERIFQRYTEAHDTLTKKRAREEYDAYLATSRANRAAESALSDTGALEIERIRRAIEEQAHQQARLDQRRSSAPPGGGFSSPSAAPTPSAPPAAQALARPGAEPPRELDPEERRRALARRLGRSPSMAGRLTPPPPAAQSSVPPREAAVDELRRRYEARVAQARHQHVHVFVEQADEAERRGDPVAAAGALRLAAQLAPGDTALAERLARLQRAADTQLADGFLKQAKYEEQSGRFSEAARSYERAAKGKRSSVVLDAAARCLLEVPSADLRHAAELAREAVALSPQDANFRKTLATIYLKAGLRQSAESEFERASSLAPNDDSLKGWLKRLKRQEI